MRIEINSALKLKGTVLILDYIRTCNNFNFKTDECQNHDESVYSIKEMQ